jgi:hypothetical protein
MIIHLSLFKIIMVIILMIIHLIVLALPLLFLRLYINHFQSEFLNLIRLFRYLILMEQSNQDQILKED